MRVYYSFAFFVIALRGRGRGRDAKNNFPRLAKAEIEKNGVKEQPFMYFLLWAIFTVYLFIYWCILILSGKKWIVPTTVNGYNGENKSQRKDTSKRVLNSVERSNSRKARNDRNRYLKMSFPFAFVFYNLYLYSPVFFRQIVNVHTNDWDVLRKTRYFRTHSEKKHRKGNAHDEFTAAVVDGRASLCEGARLYLTINCVLTNRAIQLT